MVAFDHRRFQRFATLRSGHETIVRKPECKGVRAFAVKAQHAVKSAAYATIVASALSSVAAAQDQFSEPPFGSSQEEIAAAQKNCAVSQQAITICGWTTYQDSERQLRSTEAKLLDELNSAAQQTAFKEAQDAFVSYRNATCNFEVDREAPGSMGFSIVYNCRKSYNDRRAKAISDYLGCVAGDPPCEVPFSLFFFENKNRGSP